MVAAERGPGEPAARPDTSQPGPGQGPQPAAAVKRRSPGSERGEDRSPGRSPPSRQDKGPGRGQSSSSTRGQGRDEGQPQRLAGPAAAVSTPLHAVAVLRFAAHGRAPPPLKSPDAREARAGGSPAAPPGPPVFRVDNPLRSAGSSLASRPADARQASDLQARIKASTRRLADAARELSEYQAAAADLAARAGEARAAAGGAEPPAPAAPRGAAGASAGRGDGGRGQHRHRFIGVASPRI